MGSLELVLKPQAPSGNHAVMTLLKWDSHFPHLATTEWIVEDGCAYFDERRVKEFGMLSSYDVLQQVGLDEALLHPTWRQSEKYFVS